MNSKTGYFNTKWTQNKLNGSSWSRWVEGCHCVARVDGSWVAYNCDKEQDIHGAANDLASAKRAAMMEVKRGLVALARSNAR